MPKQKSFLRLHGGSLGETTFVKRDGKYTAKEKRADNPEKRGKSPQYARVRENESEFGTASTSGKILRKAIDPLLALASDNKLVPRLQGLILKAIKKDPVSERSKRHLSGSNLPLLLGFNFNKRACLRAVFHGRFSNRLDRETGELTLTIPSFQPGSSIMAPKGTTHFQIISAGVAINFADLNEHSVKEILESPIIELSSGYSVPVTAIHHVDPQTTMSLFLIMGLRFFQVVGDVMEPVKMNLMNPLCIVAVN